MRDRGDGLVVEAVIEGFAELAGNGGGVVVQGFGEEGEVGGVPPDCGANADSGAGGGVSCCAVEGGGGGGGLQ